MAERRLKRPRDPIALAKLVGDIATGDVIDAIADQRSPAAIARGHVGGLKGGKSRARKLPAVTRQAIAKKAAAARWKKRPR